MAEKKKFFEIEIPLTNSSAELLAYSLESLNKKTIKQDLTRQLRGKSIEVVFVIKTENKKGTAEPRKLTLLPFFIRRMLRRGISYVEDSFSAECKNAQIRIKPFFVTRKKVSRAVRKALGKEGKSWLEDYVKSRTYEEIFSDVINNKLQKSLSIKLKKIYPLSLCEIRVLKIEKLKEQEKLKITVEKVEADNNKSKPSETTEAKEDKETEEKEK